MRRQYGPLSAEGGLCQLEGKETIFKEGADGRRDEEARGVMEDGMTQGKEGINKEGRKRQNG